MDKKALLKAIETIPDSKYYFLLQKWQHSLTVKQNIYKYQHWEH